MSRAFVSENDDQWLSEVSPTMSALIVFLTHENNGVRIYERSSFSDKSGRHIHVMSNGLAYGKDAQGRWEVVEKEARE